MRSSNTTSSFAPPSAKASDGSPWGEYHAKVPPGNAVKHARLREVSSCLLSAPQFIEPVESAAAVKRGAKVFKASCSSCHTIEASGPRKQGPNLSGLLTRGTPPGAAASAAAYPYSRPDKHGPGLLGAQQTGLVWTRGTLIGWLKSPKNFAPGHKMVFAGLRDDRCVDVVAYLEEATEKAAEEATREETDSSRRNRAALLLCVGAAVFLVWRSRKQQQKQPSNLLQSAVAKL